MDETDGTGLDHTAALIHGVLLNLQTKEIRKTKVITTRYDLTLAVENCLDALTGVFKENEETCN